MFLFLASVQMIISIALIGAILLQPGESGFMSGGGFLSGGENYHTRRGVEKVLFFLTFFLIAAFCILSLLAVR